MKSEIIKHRSGGCRFGILLTFAIAFVIAMCSWSEARADNIDCLYTVYSDGVITFNYATNFNTVNFSQHGDIYWRITGKEKDWLKKFANVKGNLTTVQFATGTSLPASFVGLFNNCPNLATIKGTTYYNSSLNLSDITDLSYFFANCPKLKEISLTLTTSANVTTMEHMFEGCTSLQSVKFSNNFNFQNVQSMAACFHGCTSLKTVTGLKSSTQLLKVNQMFAGCHKLQTIDLSNLNVDKVDDFAQMFRDCPLLQEIVGMGNWTNSEAIFMSEMFGMCISLKEIDLHGFNTWKVRTMAHLFNMYNAAMEAPQLKNIYVGPGWSTQNVTDGGSDMFYNCTTIRNYNKDYITLSKAYVGEGGYLTPYQSYSRIYAIYNDHTLTFYYDPHFYTESYPNYYDIPGIDGNLPSWHVHASDITKVVFDESCKNGKPPFLTNWFRDFENLTKLEGFNFNTSDVGGASYMFYGCKNLTSIVGLSLQNCKNYNSMFEGCVKMESFPAIKNPWYMSRTFANCTSLKSIEISIDKELYEANGTFSGCTNLESVTFVCSAQTSDLWTTEKMFENCSKLSKIYVNAYNFNSGYDVSTGKYNKNNFSFDEYFVLSNVRYSNDMFKGCTALAGTAGTKFNSSTTDKTYAKIDKGTSAPGYFSQLNVPYIAYSSGVKKYSGEFKMTTSNSFSKDASQTGYVFTGWQAYGGVLTMYPLKTISIPNYTYGGVVFVAQFGQDISKASVSLSSSTYTGENVPLVVTFEDKTLKSGTDYTADQTVKDAKSYSIKLTGKGNYAGTKTVSLILNKASLIITPDNKTKVYGEDDPKLTYTVEGLKGSDKLTTTPTLYSSSNPGSDVGSYYIAISNIPSAGSNYDVSKKSGTLTITAKPITVTPDALSKTYGDDDPEITYTVNEGGLIGSDVLSGSLSRVAGEAVGDYNIEQGSLANKNYAITIAEGAKFTINKKDINVTPLFITKEYGQDDPELKYSYNPGDLVGSDKLTGALSRTAGEALGSYDINIGTLAEENPNYKINLGAAQFKINARNLTDPVVVLESDVFVLDNGESKPGVTVYDGTKVVDPKEYTVEYTNNTAVGEGTVTVTANGNYVFDASKKFTIIDKSNAYSVTYKTGDEITKTVYVAKNAATAEPSIIREGYSIEGFYQSAAFDESTKWDFNNKVNDHLTLYIKWIANQHKVSFELEGEPFDSPQTLAYGTTITYPEPEAREGYTFSGWNPAPSTMPDEDFTAVGSYIKNVHNITYTIDGAEYLTKEYEYGASIAIIDNPADKVGYKFSSWTIDGYTQMPATMPDEDINVTGSYIPNKHKLVFNADGVAAKTIAEFAFGTDISTAIPQEAHKTYLFTEPPTGLLMPDYDLTVDGRFEINKYNIVYKLDGEIYTTIPTDAGSTIALIENPTRDGYTFSGWKSDYTEMPDEDITISGALVPNPHSITYKEDGKELTTVNTAFGVEINTTLPQKQGYKYVPSEEIPATVPDNNLVIDGKFVAIDYTLAYYLDYEEYKTVTLHFGDKIAAEAVPEQTGYKFSGWVDLPETMPDKDLTIFGTYEKLTYTITFMDGETKKSEQKLAFGDAIKQPSMTGKLGYTYVWKNCPEYMPDEDLVIVGGYEANLHKITYMVADTVFASVMVPYGSEITAIEGPATSGNETFAWGFIPETMPDNDITVLGSVSTPVANLPENSIAAKVWSYNHTIYIETAPDSQYKIIDLQGRVITTSTTKSTHDEIQINQSGIMIVIIGNQSFKLAL